ncbi:unnamed protein product [Xylocopa violacea]|uniref:NADH dehydrogenase [ubiquinone] 1 beta subcomplex subunit 8, mitochondrial n=1 Tax=Xylocopa violacea TaxID=135666 RepID=A0ABP1P842_XYLVO
MAALARIKVLSGTLFRRNASPLIIREYCKFIKNSAFEVIRNTKTPADLENTPDAFPKTKEEKEKAAAKYGMHPVEYKPMPSDQRYCGDYPDLPWIGSEARDPFYPWDFPHLRRNYEEPVHMQYDIMTEDRYEFGVRQHVSDLQGALIYWGIIGALAVLYSISGDTSQPLMEKQYPYSDRKHYTFNLIE